MDEAFKHFDLKRKKVLYVNMEALSCIMNMPLIDGVLVKHDDCEFKLLVSDKTYESTLMKDELFMLRVYSTNEVRVGMYRDKNSGWDMFTVGDIAPYLKWKVYAVDDKRHI